MPAWLLLHYLPLANNIILLYVWGFNMTTIIAFKFPGHLIA